jgi:hypothetical protein
VYLAAAEAFGLAPHECMMVSAAAHSSDIVGAGTAGLRNATVGRADEFGPGTAVTVPKENVDIVAKDLHDLPGLVVVGPPIFRGRCSGPCSQTVRRGIRSAPKTGLMGRHPDRQLCATTGPAAYPDFWDCRGEKLGARADTRFSLGL